MSDVSRRKPSMTVGIDLGDKYSYLCVLDTESGEVIEEGRLRTTREALERRFSSEQRPLRIAIETGTHSPWVSRVLEECAHEVLVANPRKTRLIYSDKRKTDEMDAENLARLARVDPRLLYPLKHRGEESQAHLALIRSREALVSTRTQLVNHVPRERSSPSGQGYPKCPAVSFHKKRASEHIPEALLAGHLGPSWSRGRLPHTAHPSIRPKAGGDLPRALPTNGSPAPGRGDRGAHGAYLRADLGEPLPLCKEPLGRSVPGARSSHTALRREGPPKTHLQGGRPDVKEAFGRLRLYYVLDPSAPILTSGATDRR
jgi:hypothetical protein